MNDEGKEKDYTIVMDSACDLNEEIKRRLPLRLVPLSILLGDHHLVDENLNLKDYLEEMRRTEASPQTASPSPNAFMKWFGEAENTFVVTLSSKISSTYNSAELAKNMFLEQHAGRFVHVFDSFSASVGQSLVGLKLAELLQSNLNKENIIEHVNQYIREMKTIFLLDSLEHLVKSGRLNRFAGTLATWLSIKPILCETDGTIDLCEKVRGSKKAFQRFIDLIGETGERLEEKILGIAHCNCLDKALALQEEVVKRYDFKEILIVEMGPTIASYADEGALLISF